MEIGTRNSMIGAGIGTGIGAAAGIAADKLIKEQKGKAWTSFVSGAQKSHITNRITKDVFEIKSAKKNVLNTIKGVFTANKGSNIIDKANRALANSEEIASKATTNGLKNLAERFNLTFEAGKTNAKELITELAGKEVKALEKTIKLRTICRKANFIAAGVVALATLGAVIGKAVSKKADNVEKN